MFDFTFDPVDPESDVYRIDNLFLEIEHRGDDMILHQVLKIVEEETKYGEVKDVEQIVF